MKCSFTAKFAKKSPQSTAENLKTETLRLLTFIALNF